MPPDDSLNAFALSLRSEGLGARTVTEYVAVVRRVEERGNGWLNYVQSIEDPASRLAPLAAMKRWFEFNRSGDELAKLADYQRRMRGRTRPASNRNPFSPAEYQRLAQNINRVFETVPERFALKVLVRIGARRADVAGISREALEVAKTNGGLGEIVTKGDRRRIVDFNDWPEEVAALLKTKNWRFLYELLAPAGEKRQASLARGCRVVALRFATLCERSKVSRPWITHRCRHTIASVVYNTTKDIVKTRDFMGWSNVATAERYIHGAKFRDIKRDVAAALPTVDGPRKR